MEVHNVMLSKENGIKNKRKLQMTEMLLKVICTAHIENINIQIIKISH